MPFDIRYKSLFLINIWQEIKNGIIQEKNTDIVIELKIKNELYFIFYQEKIISK